MSKKIRLKLLNNRILFCIENKINIIMFKPFLFSIYGQMIVLKCHPSTSTQTFIYSAYSQLHSVTLTKELQQCKVLYSTVSVRQQSEALK